MSYQTTRKLEQLRMLDHSIDDFIDRFNNSSGPVTGGPRHTVFLFPGGMASRLKRATAPYVDGMSSTQAFAYETVWLNIDTLLGAVLDLRQFVVNGQRRDKGDRIIVADGLVKFLGCSPYDGFTTYCEAAGLDYFVFGWDWRAAADQIGTFFAKKFLPYFQQRVKNECNNADALANFSLVGHSAGGMVVNWLLRKHDVPQLRWAITVSTPFYGYGGQEHRWFEGEPYFNFLGLDKIIRVITSMPGCYSYQFLPESVFIANQTELAADPAYPLAAYPSTDKTAPAVVADAYNPKTQGSLHRYPAQSTSGFDPVELARAKKLVKFLASNLDPTIAKKFVNVRGDTGKNDTLSSITWDWVPPAVPTPIADSTLGPGDGTQPGWTARHVGLAKAFPGKVLTVQGSDVEHMLTMNSPTTVATLAAVLST